MKKRYARNENKLPDALRDFPKSERWRLFIDGNRQAEGPKAFDVKEPGYLKGAQNAFDLMLSGLGKPLTSEMFLTLHNAAISEVNNEMKKREKPVFYRDREFQFRGREGIEFGLVMNTADDVVLQRMANVSPKGLVELVEYALSEEGRYIELIGDNGFIDMSSETLQAIQRQIEEGGVRCFSAKDTIENMIARIDREIENYYQSLSVASSSDDQLSAIVTLVKNLEVNHFFTDANCRTTVCLIMNKLLLENDFAPVIFANPNRVDGFSKDEVISDVNVAMTHFQSFCISPEAKQFLSNVDLNELKNPSAFCEKLMRVLSDQPLQTMGQISHLVEHFESYVDIKQLSVARKSRHTIFNDAHKNLMGQLLNSVKTELRDCYVTALGTVIDQKHEQSGERVVDNKALADIIEGHSLISSDSRSGPDNALSKISSMMMSEENKLDNQENNDFDRVTFKA